MEKFISVSEGEQGILNALQSSQPGDTIILESGLFEIHKTLDLPEAITFKGSPDTQISYITTFNEEKIPSAISIDVSHNVTLKDLRITLSLESLPIEETEDPKHLGSVVGIKSSNHSFIENLTISTINAKQYISGIRLDNSEAESLLENKIYDCRNGIAIVSSKVAEVLSNNICYQNERHGIVLWQNSEVKSLNNNQCYENKGDGIYLNESKVTETLSQNICFNNDTGVDLWQNSEVKSLNNNQCYENKQDGICLSESKAVDTLSHNICYKNGLHGIELQEQSEAKLLEHNQCFENKQAGISIHQSKVTDTLSQNICFKNNSYGINLQEQSEAKLLVNNQCFENKPCGIRLSKSKILEKLSSNICHHNQIKEI